MTFYHAYRADILDEVQAEAGARPITVLTVIGPTVEDHAASYEGAVSGHGLLYKHVATWDHEPSNAECMTVQGTG